MTLAYILVFVLIAAILGIATRKSGRLPVLLAISALAVFALQPALAGARAGLLAAHSHLGADCAGMGSYHSTRTTPLAGQLAGNSHSGGNCPAAWPDALSGYFPPADRFQPAANTTDPGCPGNLWRWQASFCGVSQSLASCILSAAFVFVILDFSNAESSGAIGMGQPGTARLEWAIHFAGFSTGLALAGFFVYCFSPAAYPARPPERAPAGGEPVRVRGLRDLFPGAERRSDRPY